MDTFKGLKREKRLVVEGLRLGSLSAIDYQLRLERILKRQALLNMQTYDKVDELPLLRKRLAIIQGELLDLQNACGNGTLGKAKCAFTGRGKRK